MARRDGDVLGVRDGVRNMERPGVLLGIEVEVAGIEPASEMASPSASTLIVSEISLRPHPAITYSRKRGRQPFVFASPPGQKVG